MEENKNISNDDFIIGKGYDIVSLNKLLNEN